MGVDVELLEDLRDRVDHPVISVAALLRWLARDQQVGGRQDVAAFHSVLHRWSRGRPRRGGVPVFVLSLGLISGECGSVDAGASDDSLAHSLAGLVDSLVPCGALLGLSPPGSGLSLRGFLPRRRDRGALLGPCGLAARRRLLRTSGHVEHRGLIGIGNQREGFIDVIDGTWLRLSWRSCSRGRGIAAAGSPGGLRRLLLHRVVGHRGCLPGAGREQVVVLVHGLIESLIDFAVRIVVVLLLRMPGEPFTQRIERAVESQPRHGAGEEFGDRATGELQGTVNHDEEQQRNGNVVAEAHGHWRADELADDAAGSGFVRGAGRQTSEDMDDPQQGTGDKPHPQAAAQVGALRGADSEHKDPEQPQ